MGRKFYFILVLFLGALILCSSDSKGLRREVTCYHGVLNLDCGENNIIAIHQAYFTSQRQENQASCRSLLEYDYIEDEHEEFANKTYCYEDARLVVNRRCSGLKNCSFGYSTETERRCSNPDGVLIVQYDCVRIENINKYCNAKVSASEGYIMQPGYPKYYPELSKCSWVISAAEGQTILVKILHLHLSAPTEITPTVSDHDSIYAMSIGLLTEQIIQCDKDSLSILEGNLKRFSMCGEDLGNLKTFEADASNDLVLKFKSSGFSPANGFMAFYKIQGCPDIPAGENSFLVERNSTAAIYACNDGYVFNDTLEGTRFLQCIRDHHWSNTLSPCIQVVVETTTHNSLYFSTAIGQLLENNDTASNETEVISSEPRFTEDILIPCIIMGILIVGNIIIIIIICMLRRKNKDIENEEAGLGEPINREEAETEPLNNRVDRAEMAHSTNKNEQAESNQPSNPSH